MLQNTYPKFVYVLDNASCHRSEKVNRFIESTGRDIVLVFLPPYTPQLNPIEVQWQELKRLLAGQCFHSLEDLRDAIEAMVDRDMKPVRIMPYLTDPAHRAPTWRGHSPASHYTASERSIQKRPNPGHRPSRDTPPVKIVFGSILVEVLSSTMHNL